MTAGPANRCRRSGCASHPARLRRSRASAAGPDTDDRAVAFREWVVLLESASHDDAPLIDIATVHAVLGALGDEEAVALHGGDRVSVQVRQRAADPAIALSRILDRWRDTAVPLMPAGWDVVRAEVLTPDEFRRDCEVA
jgi:hypothetical protein